MIFVHELFFSSVDGRRRERESRLFSTDPECVTAAYCRDWRRGPSVVYQGRRLKVHQSAAALASGILEYEDIPDADGDGIMDKGDYKGERGAGEMSAASQLFGWGR